MLLGMLLKFQKKLTSSFFYFLPTRKRNAGQNPGTTKIPLPLRAADKRRSNYTRPIYHLPNEIST